MNALHHNVPPGTCIVTSDPNADWIATPITTTPHMCLACGGQGFRDPSVCSVCNGKGRL